MVLRVVGHAHAPKPFGGLVIRRDDLQTGVVERPLVNRTDNLTVELDRTEVGGELDPAELARAGKSGLMRDSDASDRQIEQIDTRDSNSPAERLGKVDPRMTAAVGGYHWLGRGRNSLTNRYIVRSR